MKKLFFFTVAFLLSGSVVLAEIPAGYVPLSCLTVETPLEIESQTNVQILGPSSGWDASTDCDVSSYGLIELGFTFTAEDAGKQIAIRYAVNGVLAATSPLFVTFPDDGSTTCIAQIRTKIIANENNEVKLGGIVVYNGNAHWSFSYPGTPTAQKITLNYVALKEIDDDPTLPGEIPSGYVALPGLNEPMPASIGAVSEKLILGPGQGWGEATDCDVSNYELIEFGFAFSAEDAGKQIAIRSSANGALTTISPLFITFPDDGSTTHVEQIRTEWIVNANNEVKLGGIMVYNGNTHWSFTYPGTPTSQAITLNYVAIKPKGGAGIVISKTDNPDAIINVYSVSGVLLRQGVKVSEATEGLEKGLYIAGNKKVFVAK